MRWLELKIPPPLLALLTAGVMWFLSHSQGMPVAPTGMQWVLVVLLAIAGVGFDIAGILSFRRARTTVNPLRPNATSALVCSGVYRLTRNPMYLGLLFLLLAWTVYLYSLAALPGPLFLVVYLNRFQIQPEERVMLGLFGADYAAYQARVRRWLGWRY